MVNPARYLRVTRTEDGYHLRITGSDRVYDEGGTPTGDTAIAVSIFLTDKQAASLTKTLLVDLSIFATDVFGPALREGVKEVDAAFYHQLLARQAAERRSFDTGANTK